MPSAFSKFLIVLALALVLSISITGTCASPNYNQHDLDVQDPKRNSRTNSDPKSKSNKNSAENVENVENGQNGQTESENPRFKPTRSRSTPQSRRLEAVLSQQPTSISVDPPKGPDVEDKLVIYENEDGEAVLSVTPRQMCDICHSTIDTGVSLLRRGIALSQQPQEVRDMLMKQHGIQFSSGAFYNPTNDPSPGLLQWDSQSMADEICEGAMGHFKPQYTVACHDIIANYHDHLWAPWNHIDRFPSLIDDGDVLQHKLKFCYQTKMCVTGIGLVEEQRPSPETTPEHRTPCQSCLELANDSRMMFKRLMTTIPNPDNNPKIRERCTMSEHNFEGFKKVWCDSLSMRHFHSETLKDVCKDITSDLTSAKMYEVVKDGNSLHRLLKNATNWELTLCEKISPLCGPGEHAELYHTWDQAADFDYNITQARYVLDQQLLGHQTALQKLEEEYFYTPKYMYAPDPDTMSEDEIFAYKEYRKRAKELEDLAKLEEDVDLDQGQDADDLARKNARKKFERDEKLREQELQRKEDLLADEIVLDDDDKAAVTPGMSFNAPPRVDEVPTSDGIDDSDRKTGEEESTDLSPEMAKRLLGKLSYVDDKGVRVPNELPPHILREYRAKRHQLMHSVKHQKAIKSLQESVDKLKEEGKQWEGKRRVWALPDSMLVSERMSVIMNRIMDLKEKRRKGKIVEQQLQAEYQDQLKTMRDFSTNFENTDISRSFDLDLDNDDDFTNTLDNIGNDKNQDPIIDNETEDLSNSNSNNNNKAASRRNKDEL